MSDDPIRTLPARDHSGFHPTPTDSVWGELLIRAAASSDQLALLRTDQVARWRADDCVPAEVYLEAFPDLSAEDALVLIMAEVGLRRLRGADRGLAEYQQRFPQFADNLAIQFELHRHLGAVTPASLSDTGINGVAERGWSPVGPVPGYELAEEVGRGGMGVVFRARDTSLDRHVAVKFLRADYPPDSPAARRFVAESRITGQLQHPGIPAVHQVGTLADGRPYLAMKLIKGQTLDHLLRERVDASRDRSRFVAIFEQIAQAVGYAHAHKVIHRDLKPANVMVGEFGEVQVMDWGLAKVLTEGQHDTAGPDDAAIYSRRDTDDATRAGSAVGTPAYMPREQAIGAIDQIDERSDVFGLGGILCAILTGTPPYVAPSGESAQQMAAMAELTDALTRLDECGAEPDLVALCKRCLSSTKADRPANAGVVAKAVAELRAAADERARRAEVERERIEVREVEQRKRRRAIQVAAGVVAAVLVLGIVGTTIGLVRANDAADAERVANQAAQEEKARAERAAAEQKAAKEKAEQATAAEIAAKEQAQLDKAVALAVRDFLQSRVLRKANPYQHASGAADEKFRHDVTVRELLDRAAKEFSPDTISSKFPGQPVVQAEILETIAEAYEGLNELTTAVTFMSAAHAIREKHLGPNHVTTLVSLTNVVFVDLSARRHAEAMRNLLRLIERLESVIATSALAGKGSPDDPIGVIFNAVYGKVEQRVDPRFYAYPAMEVGLTDGALLFLQLGQALPRVQRLAALCRERFGSLDRRTLVADFSVAICHHGLGQVRKACDLYEELIRSGEKFLSPDDWTLMFGRDVLVVAYSGLGIKKEEMLRLIEVCAQTKARLLGDDHPSTLDTRTNLAIAYRGAGRLPQAITVLEQVHDRRVKNLGPDHRDALATLTYLAEMYQEARRWADAIRVLEQLREAAVKKLGPEAPDTIIALANLAVVYWSDGRLEKALPLFEQAATGIANRRFRDRFAEEIIRQTIGACEAAGELAKAEGWQRKWLAFVKTKGGTSTPAYERELVALGRNLMRQKKWADAEPVLREYLALRQKGQPNAAALLAPQSMLGEALMGQKKYAEAEPLLREYLNWHDKQPNVWSLTKLQGQLRLGEALVGQQKFADAESLLLKSLDETKQRAQISRLAREGVPDVIDRLIDLYAACDKPDEVKNWRDERAKYPNLAPPPRAVKR